MEPFLLRALLAGLALALTAGPLGCFIMWRRMAYFGDALSHSALLGVAMGIALGIPMHWTILAVALLFAAVLVFLDRFNLFPTDTLVGLVAHGALALSLVTVAFVPALKVDLMSFLFGDLLAVSWADVVGIAAGSAALLVVLSFAWTSLLRVTINEELAHAEGVSLLGSKILFLVLIAVAVAISIQVVGILLITALLIIPAAGARAVSHSPEMMGAVASAIGMTSVAGGLGLSYASNTPVGPGIILVATAIFCLSLAIRLIGRR